jgi:hypothetical protein
MMKQSDKKRSSSLLTSIICHADLDDSDSIAGNNTEDDSCVTRERMHPCHLADQQEIINFKLQFARQQEMLDNLSLKLSKCEVEIDALKTENAVLIDERALAAAPTVRSKGWFSSSECRGSMQMLISVNAKYMTDNSHLHVERDVLHVSFRSYVKDSHRIVTALQKENDALRHILQDCTRLILLRNGRNLLAKLRPPHCLRISVISVTTMRHNPNVSRHGCKTKRKAFMLNLMTAFKEKSRSAQEVLENHRIFWSILEKLPGEREHPYVPVAPCH